MQTKLSHHLRFFCNLSGFAFFVVLVVVVVVWYVCVSLLVFCMSKLYFREFCLQCSDDIFYLTEVIYVYISLRPKIRFISEMSVENKTL